MNHLLPFLSQILAEFSAARTSSQAQARGAARAGEHAGGRDLVAAGRAVEPVAAVLALWVG